MKQPKFLRWLRSRPLARVRRTLATRRRAEDYYRRGVFTPEMRERLTRTDALARDLKQMYRTGVARANTLEYERRIREEHERDAP